MGALWIFNAELRAGNRWQIPAALPPRNARVRPIGGEFGFTRGNSIAARMFFGADALFPFARGRPPGKSEFCDLWDAHWPGWDSDLKAHWINFEQLYVGLWSEPTVLMESAAELRFADLFGDGSQHFPEAALLAAGATATDFGLLREQARLAACAIDHRRDTNRGEFGQLERIAKTQPDLKVTVSWQASIDWLLPICADNFHNLHRLGNPVDLRVIAYQSS